MNNHTDSEELTEILDEVRRVMNNVAISDPIFERIDTEIGYDRVKLCLYIQGNLEEDKQ